jgi:hypothetical protein
MTDKALIVTPTGCPLFFDNEYNHARHWRFALPERTYETVVVGFKDEYIPEANSFDTFHRYPIKYKWKQTPKMLDDLGIKWYNYDFIGIWDDDYCTDIPSVNRALELARTYDFPFFQQSLTSWTVYPCLVQNKEHTFTRTNFTEMGVCFYRNDIFRKVLRLLSLYQYRESEWGIDKIMADYLGLPAYVVHETSIKHMRRESWYDKTNAFNEMNYLTNEWFPNYMKNVRGNSHYIFRDVQHTLATYKEERK